MSYRPLLYTSCTLDYFQSLKSSLVPKYTVIFFKRMPCQSGSFQVTYFQVSPMFPQSHVPWSACFLIVFPATFTGKTIDTIRSPLWTTYWPSSHEWVSHGVPQLENTVNIVSVLYAFELLRDTSYIRYRYKTEWLHLLLPKNISHGFADSRNPMRQALSCRSSFKVTISSDRTCCFWYMTLAL